jgi:serine/threonine protein kinase
VINNTSSNDSSSYDDFSIENIPYIEPQLLLDETYQKDTRSDIYSFGVIMWEISSGKSPYNNKDLNKNDLISIILKNNRETIISDTPKIYSDLYTECWNNDPNRRPAIKIILNKINNLLNVMKSGWLFFFFFFFFECLKFNAKKKKL